jgi:hypothetical protein
VSAPCYDLVLRHGTIADDLSANSDFCSLLNSEVPGLFYKRIKIMIYEVLFLKPSASHLVSEMNKHSSMVPRLWNLKKGRWFRKDEWRKSTNICTISLYGRCLCGRLKLISSTGQT